MTTPAEGSGGAPGFPCAFCQHAFESAEKLDLHTANFHPGQVQPQVGTETESLNQGTSGRGENRPDARYDRSDLKARRNKDGEARLVPAIQSTALLHGTNAYTKAIRTTLGEHGVAVGTLVRSDDEPVLVIPLSRVYAPSRENDQTIPGGMLVTLGDRAIIAWQQFREGRSGSLGMCDACVRTIAYSDVQAADADKALISITTADRYCQFIPLNFLDKQKRQQVYRQSVVQYVLNSFLSVR